jgi:hypothetical protein
MNGSRVRDIQPYQLLKAGEYGESEGVWYACTPTGEQAALGAHDVIEHEDGTITVSPSIEVSTSRNGAKVPLWHGFLERGVWRLA